MCNSWTVSLSLWGSGTPRREFLHVDDLADAIFFLLDIINSKDIYNRDISHLNIGTGQDLTIFNLARIIMSIVGYRGNIIFDSSKPDGVIKKLLNVDIMLDLGWKPKIEMQKGIKETYNWYKKIVLNKE
ncbi:NAD-dependent epimerase/dehydratase family protein [bacterium]|nr:NAD-dependent epimerase/dehydratase family protein [bacterium]MBU1873237.1 NAD-dependent epimerase/dehydratase family protein [bacterium]